MAQTVPEFDSGDICVVHGQLLPENWIEAKESKKLYLLHWDASVLADEMLDNAYIISHFIHFDSWRKWTLDAGLNWGIPTLAKISWYGRFSFLRDISQALSKDELEVANRSISALRQFISHF